ncbi:hypothetical protein Lalb_Chr18g0043991 [Lupinus albus]|uniref:Uncharacterized protein n=1 Tax=Lupinus albus TaxID=3870 RepID=A0A6A4NN38_LUPAL|nr:hypothetical protein Lalb_Chr18g0043991 [Lupinus albus]
MNWYPITSILVDVDERFHLLSRALLNALPSKHSNLHANHSPLFYVIFTTTNLPLILLFDTLKSQTIFSGNYVRGWQQNIGTLDDIENSEENNWVVL